MAYLHLLAYCHTYIWSLPLFYLCIIHSYYALTMRKTRCDLWTLPILTYCQLWISLTSRYTWALLFSCVADCNLWDGLLPSLAMRIEDSNVWPEPRSRWAKKQSQGGVWTQRFSTVSCVIVIVIAFCSKTSVLAGTWDGLYWEYYQLGGFSRRKRGDIYPKNTVH